jgi:hypothetical protein
MAKPRIFISSTFYDLKQVRSDLENFIESLGYEAVRNEEGDIPYGKDDALEEYCYKEVKNVDILVSIIGGRFGNESKRNLLSISQLELRTALKEGKQVYIFIEKNVLSEFETYLLNKENPAIKYRYIDDVRIYTFIEEIKSLSSNNNIKGFETASDISSYLKEQFAGLFQRFLEEQIRIKEISIINNLEKTAQTLNKLVNFLSDENKDQTEEINRILMINHPLVEEIALKIKVPYKFYIETFEDLEELFQARKFKRIEEDIFAQDLDFYSWKKEGERKIVTAKINKNLFDKENRLKFVKRSDWDDENLTVYEEDKPSDNELPF